MKIQRTSVEAGEDFVNMDVALTLQKYSTCVSVLYGGFDMDATTFLESLINICRILMLLWLFKNARRVCLYFMEDSTWMQQHSLRVCQLM